MTDNRTDRPADRQADLLLRAARESGESGMTLGAAFADTVMRSIHAGGFSAEPDTFLYGFHAACRRFLLVATPLTAAILLYVAETSSLDPLAQLDGVVELIALENV